MLHKTACKLDHTTAGFWVDESINRFGNLYNFRRFKDSKARALVGGWNISEKNMFVIICHLKQSSLLDGWTPKKCTENLKTHFFVKPLASWPAAMARTLPELRSSSKRRSPRSSSQRLRPPREWKSQSRVMGPPQGSNGPSHDGEIRNIKWIKWMYMDEIGYHDE